MRIVPPFLLIGSAVCALAAGVIVGSASGATPEPPMMVKSGLWTRRTGTLAPGARVKPSQLVSSRVFVDGEHGFALASLGSAQYPAATADGGRRWRTDGPALHIDAANGPAAVAFMGATSPRTAFAYGQGNAVDVTSDSGRHWYGAFFDGDVMAVVPGFHNDLVVFIDASTGSPGTTGPTWQYVSRNGGRTWHYTTAVGG